MIGKFTKILLLSSVLGMVSLNNVMPTLALETLKGEQVAKNASVITAGSIKIHTIYGISNSHIIETANKLWVIDTQFIAPQTKGLKKYIKQLGKPVAQIILSHNHPDHWFGAHLLSDVGPIATTANITADLKNKAARYIKILKKNKKLKGSVPDAVIVPSQVVQLGKQSWDGLEVIVEEYADQEAHNSLLIKIPSLGVMIGQDMFYNNMFLVASERKRNKNWRDLLHGFYHNETKADYKTLLVGHGKNGGPDILVQDIKYLDALEVTLSKGLSLEETTKSLIAQFPNKGGKSMLGISMNNLFKGH